MDSPTVYDSDPVAQARRWVEQGAEALHVVDLDGAREGEPKNMDVVLHIRRAVDVTIQVGGGIRSHQAAAQYLEAGLDRIVLSTRAAQDPQFLAELCARYPGRVVVAIDARQGRVALRGWVELSEVDAIELARRAEELGAAALIYTDIAQDGTLGGPNLDATRDLARCVSLPVIASGGVSSLEDLRLVKSLEPFGVEGVIVGKALYEGRLDLTEALRLLAES
jgi:phosphoribosylformimino-5-aminoimidazole carboxamide ribotide isomerase